MRYTPIDFETVNRLKAESGLPQIGKASIREVVKIVNQIESATGQKFIRMEMGVPGLPAAKVGVEAEKEALNKGVAAIYPNIEGIPELKSEASRFIKLFLNIDLEAQGIVPTTGSMQAGYVAFMLTCRRDIKKDTVLFLDPGFPVQKQQIQVQGLKYESFDVYDYRGDALEAKIESYLKKGNIASIIYSNPNNPSWICFTEKELASIGKLATKYDVVVIEDLAYFGMDFRADYSQPGVAPYQPTVARYTNQYILMISSSKVFNYAGQRIGLMAISNDLYSKKFPDLKRFFASDSFGHAAVFGALYALSSGTSHSSQYALAAMLKAANDGSFNFLKEVSEYGAKAKIMKELFTRFGFQIVYSQDDGRPIGDGFYFTISYPGFSGSELIEELLYYGISAISLDITGSEHSEGLRACVSQVQRSQFPDLENRLKSFHEHHPVA